MRADLSNVKSFLDECAKAQRLAEEMSDTASMESSDQSQSVPSPEPVRRADNGLPQWMPKWKKIPARPQGKPLAMETLATLEAEATHAAAAKLHDERIPMRQWKSEAAALKTQAAALEAQVAAAVHEERSPMLRQWKSEATALNTQVAGLEMQVAALETEPVVPSLELRDATWQTYKQSLRQSSEARRDLLSAEAGARHRLMQGRCREAPRTVSVDLAPTTQRWRQRLAAVQRDHSEDRARKWAMASDCLARMRQMTPPTVRTSWHAADGAGAHERMRTTTAQLQRRTAAMAERAHQLRASPHGGLLRRPASPVQLV